MNLSKRTTAFLAAVLLVTGLSIPTVVPRQSHALQLASRSLTVSSSAVGTISTDLAGNAVAPGAGGNGVKAKHTVKFTMASSAATVGSVLIMYCTSPIFQATCTTPTGLTAQNITAATVSGQTAGTYTLDTATSNSTINSALPANTGTCNGASAVRTNCVAVSGSATAQTGTPTITIAYGGNTSDYVTNPSASNCAGNDNCQFYARVIVFSDAAYTTQVDFGGLAASTAQQVDITAKVQEALNFSVGTTVTAPSTNCASFSDTGALSLGDINGVLSIATGFSAHSYFRVNSNTLNGTVIYYAGDTLKSGANSITSVGLSGGGGTNSTVGTSQFGLAIDSSDTQTGSGYSFTNLAANNGVNIAGHAFDYSQGAGTITTGGTAKFQFDTASVTTPRPIAKSTGGISCDTGSIRYLGNISTSTPAGIYTTTITYIATGTY